jgi:hypothetical protein
LDTAVLKIAGISGTSSARRVPFSQAIAEAGYEALDQGAQSAA